MFQSMFLCAGLGTRLRPLTLEFPKALVPVGDRPLLAHLLDHLRAAGGTLRAVNTHHRPEKIRAFLDGYDVGVNVSLETELLGTAGGIARARQWFGPEPLVVWNGDILAQPSLSEMVEALDEVPVALAVALRPRGQGPCGVDADGNITRLRGERYGEEVSGADYMGIAALREDALRRLPERGCLVGDYLMPFLRAQGTVKAAVQTCGFRDVGSLASYLQANVDWLHLQHRVEEWTTGSGKARVVGAETARVVGAETARVVGAETARVDDPDDERDARSNAPSFVHPSASVDGEVQLRDCVVMSDARVRGRGRLDRVVVWPGATAVAPLRDAVVTTHSGVVAV